MQLLYLSFGFIVGLSSVSIDSVEGHSTALENMDAMKELALIMAAAAGQELDVNAMNKDSVKCINKEAQGWSQSLTGARLKEMVTIFIGMGFVPRKTYIFVPECPKLKDSRQLYQGLVYYSSGDGKHAEDNMIANCGLPKEFYLTSSPCPDCAIELLDRYKSHRGPKPLIYIARRYTGGGKSKLGEGRNNINMICLAMLVQAGFELVPWNWLKFQRFIDNRKCLEIIQDMSDNQNRFNERLKDTKDDLGKVIMAAKSTRQRVNYEADCRRALGK